MTYEAVRKAADFVAAATGRESHDVALVLGSGLGSFAEGLAEASVVPYQDIPGFPPATVEGHSGRLVSARIGSGAVLVLAGRAHLYEGLAPAEIVFGVRTAVLTGCRTVVLTNAAGAIGRDLEPGDLVLITDHLNLTARNPLIGENDSRLGPRFPDMTEVYSGELRLLARRAAHEAEVQLKEGVYAWMTGPSYETPAEIRMLATLGAALVGMSTVPEALAVRHMGGRVLGISLVTNLAAGISAGPLSHEEVTATAAEACVRLGRLLERLLPMLVGL